MATETTITLQSLQQELISIKSMLALSKDVLNLDEVSLYTGFAKGSLYKLTMAGKLPHSKPNGKSIFVEKAELNKWLLGHKKQTAEEREIEAATYCATHKAKM